jgi:hypothetical protein
VDRKELETSLRYHQRRLTKINRQARIAQALIELRRRQLAQLVDGSRKAVEWALRQAADGVVESPPFSNRGPRIDQWQKDVGMQGQPWCGAFTFAALKVAGVKGLSWRMRYTPFIVEDAKAGRNGLLRVVPVADAQAGDLWVVDFKPAGVIQHVGLLVRKPKWSRLRRCWVFWTVEGNTSPGSGGSQDNGGGVYRRKRYANELATVVIARPRWS